MSEVLLLDTNALKKAFCSLCDGKVVRGEWIKSDDGTVCSNCGFALEDWIQGIFYNYCPNCGARMRKGAR